MSAGTLDDLAEGDGDRRLVCLADDGRDDVHEDVAVAPRLFEDDVPEREFAGDRVGRRLRGPRAATSEDDVVVGGAGDEGGQHEDAAAAATGGRTLVALVDAVPRPLEVRPRRQRLERFDVLGRILLLPIQPDAMQRRKDLLDVPHVEARW